MKDHYFKTLEQYGNTRPSHKIIIDSFKELLPAKGNIFAFIISVLLGIGFASYIGFSNDTVILALKIVDVLFGLVLAIFGIVFTIYSIILAFFNDKFLKKLSELKYNNETSALISYTSYYESVLFLYFISICISGIMLLVLNCIPTDFVLPLSWICNSIIAALLMFIYFSFTFRIIYELKSTIYNTIILFRATIAYKFLGFIEDDVDKGETKNDIDK